ncbi:hypothetical protein [Shewanella algicola]|uniref:hypothetical protein n=1 Tax=Shewanella algicola TaxID=640633 RepID=UPI002493D07D|nr:hypothetical protein [Shewanella algicola]
MYTAVKLLSSLLGSLLILVVLSGCGSTTTAPQYKQAEGYRYLERKITDNYYLLSVTSNHKANLLVYAQTQASTLTEQLGFDWYIIVEKNDPDNKKAPYIQTIEIRMGKGIKP